MPSKKSQSAPVRIIEDKPATEKSHFGFDVYAQTLAGLIASKENTTPLVMGIYGESGTGKTSLMNAVASRLNRESLKNTGDHRYCKTVRFNAWKHDGKDELLAAMVESVFKAMDSDGFFSLAKSKMEGLTKRIDKSKVFTSVSQLAAGTDISEFFSDMAYKEKLGYYDTFQKFFNDLVWTFLNWRFKLTEEEKPDDKRAALVIFIDDLDRCARPHIVKVLETINLFMARAGWVFVLGASKEVVETALAERYGQQASQQFMEKFIQVGFNLPQISVEAFGPLITAAGDGAKLLKDHLPLLIPAMGHNPRRVKRFINGLHVVHGLVQSAGLDLAFDKVLLWGLIDHIYPELAAHIKRHPQNLFVMQKQIKKLSSGTDAATNAKTNEGSHWEFTEDQLKEKRVPHALRVHLQIPSLAEMVGAFNVTADQFMGFQTYYRAVDFERSYPISGGTSLTRPLVDVPMSTVAAGPFLFGDDNATETIDTRFEMDIYPVTNGQYQCFVDAGGYTDPTWWSENGWQWRKEAAVERPAFWDDPNLKQGESPVVGVSWHEAEAYARWVSKALPTERQWERAARGEDGWEYPWGNDFNECRCNTEGSGQGAITPVALYSNGVSPEGCYDMAGNIWEWTATTADDDEAIYILKGGSWSDSADTARCSVQKGLSQELRHPSVGFRCVKNH